MPKLTKLLAFPILLFSRTIAQDDSHPDQYQNCSDTFKHVVLGGAVNTTGQTAFTFDSYPTQEDWYLSLTLNDTRYSETLPPKHRLGGWLSMPEVDNGDGCFYIFQGQNKSASGDGMNGCEGVLSNECIDILSQITHPTTFSPDTGPLCENLDREKIEEACGDKFTEGRFHSYLSRPLAPSNCTTPSPPNTTVPDGYMTMEIFDWVSPSNRSDTDIESFDWYNVYAQQTVPFVIAALIDNDNNSRSLEAQVVCVRPDNILEGSHASPEEDLSAGVALGTTSHVAMVIATLVSVGLLLV